MIHYRDMTFCCNEKCKKRCSRYLTPEIIKAAEQYGLPVAMSEFICLDCGEDGVYELKTEETDGKEVSKMSEDIA